ncbi:hypothetical protein Cni_G11532 [Canna indica]|uniref:FAF domain-containing protein n=1 Tax=Canna indica TaxID=4628 RepID=A0AAQ3K8Y2_9LILI|nr:hypothetical protein Cni_G11532 [Canna indica]
MSAAVMQTPSTTFLLDHCTWPVPAEPYGPCEDDRPSAPEEIGEERPGQFDIWNAIQSQKKAIAVADHPAAPYVHPLVRRSSSLLSQTSLETCTESLGSESGSGEFSSFIEDVEYCCLPEFDDEEEEDENRDVAEGAKMRQADDCRVQPPRGKQLTSVNYHCSISRRSPQRSFPPPLPSISRRNGPCIHMRPHRLDGRLVVEAVPVPSQNYLHAQRVDGRLLLSFIDSTYGDEPGYESGDASEAATEIAQVREQKIASKETEIALSEEPLEEELEEQNCNKGVGDLDEKNCYDEEEEEEEVEVVDRGTVVEVKISTQPQQQSGAMKVHRSSLVINKFVGGIPQNGMAECIQPAPNDDNTTDQNKHKIVASTTQSVRRSSPTTTTAAAAMVAASTLSVGTEGYNERSHGALWSSSLGEHHSPLDSKLVFTSKRRNREDLLHDMRRCSQLRRPLFIWEPCCIATSS